MKYKNIRAAIHNFCASHMAGLSWCSDEVDMYYFSAAHNRGLSMKFDWLNTEISGDIMSDVRAEKSFSVMRSKLKKMMAAENVDISSIKSLVTEWPANNLFPEITAVDDRGISHKVTVRV